MTRSIVDVAVPGAEYQVVIGEGLLAEAGTRLRALTSSKSVALITDTNVAERYGLALDTSLARAGFSVTSFRVPAGEASKSWSVAGELLEALAAKALDRTSVVVALGGGVVGDLAGFVAATYLRGVEFVQVPTSLLAMVDSSVGGKTAVDLQAGKNLAGAFKQPLLVLADTDTLKTLPDTEWLSGLAEVAKSAVLDGEEFLGWIEEHAGLLGERDPGTVEQAVRRSVEFKARVVARDEREEGPRECLNYGHTFGHALEKVCGYGTFTHGAAVAEGMRFASRVSADAGQADAAFIKRQDRLLDALGLTALDVRTQPGPLLDAMRSDKKARSRVVRMVLVDGPGLWRCSPVKDDTVSAHLDAWVATKGE